MVAQASHRLSRAWYSQPIRTFLSHSSEEILGHLAHNSGPDIETLQRDAWESTILLLKQHLVGRDGHVMLEFNIPRMGSRADVVLLVAGCVVILECKVGQRIATSEALNQVWEYALDTRNFHEPSHGLPIIPVLIPTECPASALSPLAFADDRVCPPVVIGPGQLPRLLDELSRDFPDPIDAAGWIDGRYRPTPTIIEAARHLYANHSVHDIARTGADATNLADTTRRLESLIDRARAGDEKIIVFITGVPGAGKTLVGLNAATAHRDNDDSHAVFLSGNGPLVTVLREALTRDDVARQRQRGERVTKKQAQKPIKAFIQNVHHFRDEGLRDRARPPVDRIVIFDEAQRAWNRDKAERWMRARKGIADFHMSEPEFLIEYLDRHQGWAAVICLVGGGQEIGSGEAGIGAWIDACITRFPHWRICISDRLQDSEYGAGEPLERARSQLRSQFHADLHLSVSMRSFRAEKVSAFVKALLDCDVDRARTSLHGFRDRYPIVVTRNLDAAKRWARTMARASERYGLLASSKAMRLKPHAVDVRVEADPVLYFLEDQDHVRSSFFLEDCATEFQVQGLELDWAVVTWDADLRRSEQGWSFHDFRGKGWQSVRSPENQRNLKNAYRVLLTRARQGMAIFVPPGAADDPTRPPAFYDETFAYLRQTGISEL
ncbi:MAG: DUF2075 domain-containing protein [Gammaproteobacteria bacterium]|nr:DUF2075 domain-containing protein [Gammaproteobacteria bacterium]